MSDGPVAGQASTLGPDFRPRRSDAVVSAEVGDELVLHDTASGGLHRLNVVGADVWRLLDGDASITRLAGELAGAYGADPADVEPSVLSLVRDLGRIGLLDGVPAELVVDQMALFLGFHHDHDHDHDRDLAPGTDQGRDEEGAPSAAGRPELTLVSQTVPQAPRYFAVPPSG